MLRKDLIDNAIGVKIKMDRVMSILTHIPADISAEPEMIHDLLVFRCYSYEALLSTNKMLAKYGYKVSFRHAWVSGDNVLFSWENDDFEVWLRVPHWNLPPQLMKGCRVENVVVNHEELRLVCGLEE